MNKNLVEVKMTYRKYKTTYSQYKTLAGSYDKSKKTIVVLLPEQKANVIKQKAGGSLRQIAIKFIDNVTNESFEYLFNYFTSAKDSSSLKRRVKEFEKLNNCTCIDKL